MGWSDTIRDITDRFKEQGVDDPATIVSDSVHGDMNPDEKYSGVPVPDYSGPDLQSTATPQNVPDAQPVVPSPTNSGGQAALALPLAPVAAPDDTPTGSVPLPPPDAPETNVFLTNLQDSMSRVAQLDAIKTKEDLMRQYHPNGKDDGMLANIGKGIMLGMKNIAPILMNPNISDKQALGYAIGSMATGGIGNAVAKDWDERTKLEYDKAQANADVAKNSVLYNSNIKATAAADNADSNAVKATAYAKNADTRRTKVEIDAAKEKRESAAPLLKGLLDGKLSPVQNQALIDHIGEMVGVPVHIDPKKAKVISSKEVYNTAERRGYVVNTYEDGTIGVLPIGIDGKPIDVDVPTVTSAQISGDARVKSEEIRAASEERIHAARNALEKQLNSDKRYAGDVVNILTAYDKIVSEGSGKPSDPAGETQWLKNAMDKAFQAVQAAKGLAGQGQ